jgi:hypothetical protein
LHPASRVGTFSRKRLALGGKFSQLPPQLPVYLHAMNHDERDELWELLGKARTPKERPFFAAKVLQAVRAEEETKQLGWGGRFLSLWTVFRRRWVVSLAGCSAVAVAVVLTLSPEAPKKPANVAVTAPADPLAGLITAAADDPDQLAASLDNLLATQDNSLWLQADLSSLY